MPTGVLGGPNSPLVLYGDTSQDGIWYSGDPSTVDGTFIGDKPFNPFVDIPIAQNEDDDVARRRSRTRSATRATT